MRPNKNLQHALMSITSHLPTVTIGIPAYNEAANIAYLLRDILSQEIAGFSLEKIIVVSDGSADRTVGLARSVGDARLIVLDHPSRKGQAARQNEIIAMTDSDILVLLNADIALADTRYLLSLLTPLLHGEADFVSGRVETITPTKEFEKALHISERLKLEVFERWRGDRNLYTCKGTARAFSKAYYSRLRFPFSIGEDTYSYFFGIRRGYRYQYVPTAVARIKLPETFRDYFRQSARYEQSKRSLTREFGTALVRREYTVPFPLLLSGVIRTLWHHPREMLLYLGAKLLSNIRSLLQKPLADNWDMSESSKRLHSPQ